MAKAPLLTLPLFATLLLSTAYGEEYLLYTPKATEALQAPASPDEGILVRHITVKRGDTLKKLSRKHLGRASWFPQVLLFNHIKNPDLIHTGDRLKVPVPPGRTASARVSAVSLTAPASAAASPATAPAPPASSAPSPAPPTPLASMPAPPTAPALSPAPATPTPSSAPTAPAAHPAAPASSDEQETFLQAKAAYRSGDYQRSLALFDQFLGTFSRSPLAADAALYRADCLLQLSVR